MFLRAPLQDILQNEGPGALFRGLESTLWRDVPFSAFYWLGVEAVRDRFLQHGALPYHGYPQRPVAPSQGLKVKRDWGIWFGGFWWIIRLDWTVRLSTQVRLCA